LAEVLVDQVENNLRFPGQYFDLESGLHHNYFRDYDAGLGRYVQGDPIGLVGGLNAFGYAFQNPTLFYDPNGLYIIHGLSFLLCLVDDSLSPTGLGACSSIEDVAASLAQTIAKCALESLNPFGRIKKAYNALKKARQAAKARAAAKAKAAAAKARAAAAKNAAQKRKRQKKKRRN